MNGIFFKTSTCNEKLAPREEIPRANGRLTFVARPPYMDCLYLPISLTCPSSCPHLDRDCYAQRLRLHKQIERMVAAVSAAEVIQWAINEIDTMYLVRVPEDGCGRPRTVRLFVSGDCPDQASARKLAACERRWSHKGGGRWFGSTHRWRTIPIEAWGNIRAYASIEHDYEIEKARNRGYAVWRTRHVHANGIQPEYVDSIKLVSCPQQTMSGVTCATCRLCLDKDLYANKLGVVFAEH